MKKLPVIVAIFFAFLCVSCSGEYDYAAYRQTVDLPFLFSDVTSVEFFAYMQKNGDVFSYEGMHSGMVNKKTTSDPKNFEPVFRRIESMPCKFLQKLETDERDGSCNRRVFSMRVYLASGKTVELSHIEFGIKRGLLESRELNYAYRNMADIISCFNDVQEVSVALSFSDANVPKLITVQ
ncbi:MAG: hypothetical protein J6I73_10480 [Treponema sp.]|nr:hypothetical protein [Treponema sp.]